MTDAIAHFDGGDLGRRELLKRGLIGGGAVAAALAAPGLTGVARAAGGKSIVLDVDTDEFDDFESTSGGFAGAFYVSGVITNVTGVFHCWGYLREDGLGVVNQEFDIDGRGKILIAGVESTDPRAITGGTGDFANARGEGAPDLTLFDSDGEFTIAFSLTGAAGPPIT